MRILIVLVIVIVFGAIQVADGARLAASISSCVFRGTNLISICANKSARSRLSRR